MKKYFIYMLAMLFAACTTVGDNTTPDDEPVIPEPTPDVDPDPAPPTDKTGIWIRYDNVHAADLDGAKYEVYNNGTYTLLVTIAEAKATEEDAEDDGGEVTYQWSSSSQTGITLDPSQDTTSVMLSLDGITDNGDYTITAKGSDDTEYTINLNAKNSKAETSKTINGKTVELRVIDNFNDAMISTNSVNGIWKPGWSSRGAKRGYWSKDAIVFADGGRGYADLRTRKGKEGEDLYQSSLGGWQLNNLDAVSLGKTDWIAGALHRNETQTHGYFEARMKINKKSKYHWNAFWAYESPKGTYTDDEIKNETDIIYEYDVMEYMEKTGSVFDQTTHWWKRGGGRVIDPSKMQRIGVTGRDDLSEWFTLGLYWDKDLVIYYVNGRETVRTYANGSGSSEGEHGYLSEDDKAALVASKGTSTVADDTLAVNQFAGMNFKFTTELGYNYAGDASDITTFESALQAALGDEGYDSFFIDYYAEYDIK